MTTRFPVGFSPIRTDHKELNRIQDQLKALFTQILGNSVLAMRDWRVIEGTGTPRNLLLQYRSAATTTNPAGVWTTEITFTSAGALTLVAGLTATTGTFSGAVSALTLATSAANSGGLTQEAWTAFAYSGTWGSAGAGPTPGFFKDSLGVVHLRGLVTGGGASTIAVLPAGYRPSSSSLRFVSDNNGTYGRADIDSLGNLTASVGGFVNRSLDGISYDTR